MDYISISISVLSFILAIISVLTVVITIMQNKRMIEAQSRPYLSVYLQYDEYNTNTYICVKNYGNTSAKIITADLTPCIKLRGNSFSDIIKNTVISPRQQLHFLLPHNIQEKLLENENNEISVSIKYQDCMTMKTYNEQNHSFINYMNEIYSSRITNTDKSNIENSLQNLENSLCMIKNLQL